VGDVLTSSFYDIYSFNTTISSRLVPILICWDLVGFYLLLFEIICKNVILIGELKLKHLNSEDETVKSVWPTPNQALMGQVRHDVMCQQLNSPTKLMLYEICILLAKHSKAQTVTTTT
uniref:Uncharacterized protein n=1 Tax=Glossina palpalis gambiensis TaxID=67801 RepID=A0A1B0APC7_9MUSC